MFKRLACIAALLCAFPLLLNAATTSKSLAAKQGQSDERAIGLGTKFTLTATAGAGGIVNPSIRSAFAGVQRRAKTFIFRPRPGYGVQAITGTYLTTTTFLYQNAATGEVIPSLPAPPGVKVKVVISNVTGSATLIGAFATIQAVAGPDQTVLTGSLVTLNGSLSTGFGPYAWSQVSGPATVTLSGANTNTATFTALTPGTYLFMLTHGATSATTTVIVTDSFALAIKSQCNNCHSALGIGSPTIYTNWSGSVHKNNFVACFDCHAGANIGGQHPGVLQCATCHGDFGIVPTDYNASCAACHTGTTVHGAQLVTRTSCIDCHSAALSHPGTFVHDNNGVRAITTEFTRWSHHVTGTVLQDAHCATCHLEGTVQGGAIVINQAYHMSDAKVHLRNADTDADMQWDPEAPNHSTMDVFCMSCHDANGATSAQTSAIRAVIVPAAGKTASALNPFGDTISNHYDKMQRPFVTNVGSQFNTTNNSQHGVKAPRYSGRTRAAGPRQIASPSTFASNSSAILWGARSTIYDAGNFNQLYTPLENAGGETAPRTGSATLGDDSTLHCGDCHTVGQWKVGSSVNAHGQPTPAAIGAHGSNNEYLLRNSIGTDERHTQNAFTVANGVITYTNPNGAFLVCYNCHNYTAYGSIFLQTGVLGGHVGEYDQTGRCNGVGNTIPFNGFTTSTATDGTQFVSRFMGPISKYGTPAPYPGEQNPDFGDIFSIQCLNCHNSGIGNAYGGIHGSANNTNTRTQPTNPSVTGGAYIDGMGNTNKVERFLPGLGNAMHVPGTLGGFIGGTVAGPVTNGAFVYTYITGGISNDLNWEQKHWLQGPNSLKNTANQARAGAGCYTLGESADVTTNVTANLNGPSVSGEGGPATTLDATWGGCDDHTAAQGVGNHGFVKKIVRPVTY